ncbi:MAG: hypothetical protein IKG99_03790 [Bacteroidaceae bacterium]|nr:hypothetical protein [Bacteroidaceae bacterium]
MDRRKEADRRSMSEYIVDKRIIPAMCHDVLQRECLFSKFISTRVFGDTL